MKNLTVNDGSHSEGINLLVTSFQLVNMLPCWSQRAGNEELHTMEAHGPNQRSLVASYSSVSDLSVWSGAALE